MKKRIRLNTVGNNIPPSDPEIVLPGLIKGASLGPPNNFPVKKEKTSVVIV